ncbi:hypothetical protein TRICI_000196 [Trichomonascus ciferrii]|uniref:Uncharacterized protein n=1 Tax=Trichomonascus ciferrii TaxID=44093 RepID=A0A642VE48_9ASCO|nr:hypothetical protein TRICI_000196 [Trichomonascus ciferrii]
MGASCARVVEERPTSQSGATKYRFVDQSVGSSGPAEKPSLTYQDLEIWHHYVANVVSWFDDGQEFWIHRIPSVGFKNKLVLHLVLSFSALHMARTGSSRTSELLLDAEKHNSIGLRGLIDLLADLQGDNYEVAMLASMLVSFCYFGKGPVEGEYLLFNEKGPGEWIVLLRGARSVIEAVNETGKDAKVNEKPNTSSRSLDYEPHTANLRSFVQTEVANGKTSSTTLDALDLLLKFYGSIYGNKPSDPSFSFALGWPYRLSPEYVDSVAGKNSTALLVFAHFTLLLHDLKSQWFMQGWANHVLCGIRKHIGQDYLNWLDWIQNQISP